MKFEMFDIVNYDKWGELVIEWARSPASRPTTITQFKDQVDRAGVVATYPREFSEVRFIESSGTDTTLTIRLPDPVIFDQVEQDLTTGQEYPLPTIYRDHMVNPKLKINDDAEKHLFHFKRVGEYTILFCG